MISLTIHGEGCPRHAHNRRGVLAGLPLALALAAEQQEREGRFSWLPSRRRDLAGGAARHRFRGGRERATRTRARPRIRTVPGPRQGSPRTPGSPWPAWRPAACPWPGRTILQLDAGAWPFQRPVLLPRPPRAGPGAGPRAPPRVPSRRQRSRRRPAERRRRPGKNPSRPAPGGTAWRSSRPPHQTAGHGNHASLLSCRSQTGTEAISGTANPRFPGPGTAPGPALWRASSPVVIVDLAATAHKTRTFAEAAAEPRPRANEASITCSAAVRHSRLLPRQSWRRPYPHPASRRAGSRGPLRSWSGEALCTASL